MKPSLINIHLGDPELRRTGRFMQNLLTSKFNLDVFAGPKTGFFPGSVRSVHPLLRFIHVDSTSPFEFVSSPTSRFRFTR